MNLEVKPEVAVVVMAAGLGTRMRSRQAKVLHRAGGQALVEHVLDAAVAIAPPHRTFVVVGHQAEKLRALLEPRGVGFISQTEQKGTGHAVMCGRDQLSHHDGLLVALNGDGPLLRPETLRELVSRTASSGSSAVMLTAELDDPTGYGRIIRCGDGTVESIVEQKAGTSEQLAIREVNTGQYCFNNQLFWKHVGELTTNNPAGEYYLTDMIEILIRAGGRVVPFPVADATELLGINNRVELAAVDAIFRARKVTELMLGGVTIEKPEAVTVDKHVTIGMDTVVEPFTRILGRTVIGENCRVGAHAILTDAIVADDVEIHPYSTIQEARIDAGAKIGPYARIRPGSLVHHGAHIGNFVELKKADVGSGAKAMHLAYLGDCTIGARTNIGAGTITCNFDGVSKHQTSVGEDAFIGSNSTLVAPLQIEGDVYVAAGSVITDDVPRGALALGRARQTVKEGWVAKRRSAQTQGSPERSADQAETPGELTKL